MAQASRRRRHPRRSGTHLAAPAARPPELGGCLLRRNAAARSSWEAAGATARMLAAGLWRLRPVDEVAVYGGREMEASPTYPQMPHPCNHSKTREDFGAHNHGRSNGILGKLEACVGLPYSTMEKATKWDSGYPDNLGEIFELRGHRKVREVHPDATTSLALTLEAELEEAQGCIAKLEAERRLTKKKLDKFLRKLAEENTSWRSTELEKFRNIVVAIKNDVKMEKKHRRRLEAANSKLIDELAEAKISAKRYTQNYENERKARELMEDACNELTREVEQDRAEIELLKSECLNIREEIEEERRMLQMAEVWREERVQMKLIDAKLALEHKYSQLSNLQTEIEAFLRIHASSDANMAVLREAEMLREAAHLIRVQNIKEFNYQPALASEDAFYLFGELQPREDANHGAIDPCYRYSSASHASNVHAVSPDSDIFLERPVIEYANGSVDLEDYSGWKMGCHVEEQGSCTSGGSGPSVTGAYKDSNAMVSGAGWDYSGENGQICSEITEMHSATTRQSRKKVSSIHRLWRSSNGKKNKMKGLELPNHTQLNGWSPDATPSPELRARVVYPTSPIVGQWTSSGSINPTQTQGANGYNGPSRGAQKHGLKAKVMAARTDGQKVKLHHALRQRV